MLEAVSYSYNSLGNISIILLNYHVRPRCYGLYSVRQNQQQSSMEDIKMKNGVILTTVGRSYLELITYCVHKLVILISWSIIANIWETGGRLSSVTSCATRARFRLADELALASFHHALSKLRPGTKCYYQTSSTAFFFLPPLCYNRVRNKLCTTFSS